ncbi:MAG TPA: Xaa-Pro peptidase family protein [Candidatus Hydrogenedentes bacterium]|nr:Xaa-Pro peptidase family protein [Candidatus Hydrogenedentota bacterium]HPC18287.1 Xaa-Pro peptidase family protein [Candidatus Hydrogenedentota bacterium]HRT22027.1 Xaa-Pro peptidase family protein [Candidatus Hydrogenedentota bacterium]HRT66723.1 Xaa-Pro peptidase family protein [Candidatus Hydrogenedentota bacterium]
MENNFTSRLEGLRRALAGLESDAFASIAPPDNQYLTGFTGSTSGVIVTTDAAEFLCDSRYTEQARQQVVAFRVSEVSGNLITRMGERLAGMGVSSVTYDPNNWTVAQMTALQKAFPGSLNSADSLVARLRMIKSPEEIDALRAASELKEAALAHVLEDLREGVTEAEVAARLEYEFKARGASGASFDTIVLFGARTSMPHGSPGETRLKHGDTVLIDLGCRYRGYCSDLTRTYACGTIPGAWFEAVYETVFDAQMAAVQAVRPGARCCDVDAVARDMIQFRGYGVHFGHGLGHGVGIEIHEGPRLNAESEVVLEPGMVVTVEPGVYLPGQGGVRIEDLVVVTEQGCEVLTRTPKALKVLNA